MDSRLRGNDKMGKESPSTLLRKSCSGQGEKERRGFLTSPTLDYNLTLQLIAY
jgi:hypothetical protein